MSAHKREIAAAARFVLEQAEENENFRLLTGSERLLAAEQASKQTLFSSRGPIQPGSTPSRAMKIGKGAVFVHERVYAGRVTITIPCRDEAEANQLYVAFGDGKAQ